MERKFTATLTIDDYNTIKTALTFELMKTQNQEAIKLLKHALETIDHATPIN